MLFFSLLIAWSIVSEDKTFWEEDIFIDSNRFDLVELPAKLLVYFSWSNESNINQTQAFSFSQPPPPSPRSVPRDLCFTLKHFQGWNRQRFDDDWVQLALLATWTRCVHLTLSFYPFKDPSVSLSLTQTHTGCDLVSKDYFQFLIRKLSLPVSRLLALSCCLRVSSLLFPPRLRLLLARSLRVSLYNQG